MFNIFIYEWHICWYGIFRKQIEDVFLVFFFLEDVFQIRDFRHQKMLAPSNDHMMLIELLVK